MINKIITFLSVFHFFPRRFLPEGSYIKAENSPGDRLAALVEYIMKNPNIYHKFHRWRNHYTISESMKFKGLCDICEFLNDANKVQSTSVKKNFRKWWFPRPLYSRCVPKGAETFSEALTYLNETKHYKYRPWQFLKIFIVSKLILAQLKQKGVGEQKFSQNVERNTLSLKFINPI